mgnify:CR=1 FL=1|jgi:hypothetical protein
MLTNSFAPIRRAGLFFGFMAMGVGALTVGSGFQETNPDSSSAVAQTKIERQLPTDTRFAAVDPAQRSAGVTKRAIGNQQALAPRSRDSVLR